MRSNLRMVVVGLLTAGAGVASTGIATASPDYQVPFPCGQQWQGSTREGHSPSYWSVDFNRDADEGDMVVASAPGRISTATNLGDVSYGRYVVVDHGAGYSSVHAHLSSLLVVSGQTVDLGDPLGLVGDTGNSFGAHLHYEQRINGVDQHAVFDERLFAYNTEVTSANCPTVPITGDWNADGRTDVGAFRRGATSGKFRELLPAGHVRVVPYGGASDTPLVGDWNGDGRIEAGRWRPVGRTFGLRMPDGRTDRIPFGKPRDMAVVGDWDGDKVTDVGVWLPGKSKFVLRLRGGSVTRYQLGRTADLPVTGDWNGDGRCDVGVYNPDSSAFRLRMPNGVIVERPLGRPGDLPVTGDWNGNGVTDLGVWSPSTATFSLRLPGGHVRTVKFGAPR